MPTQTKVAEIFNLLISDGLIGKKGKINFLLHGVSVDLETKDIIGSVIQEWFESWLLAKKIRFEKPENSQSFPDLVVGHGEYLEIKAFNWNAGPAFDIANFGSYVESLKSSSDRLKADYIIFGYSMKGSEIKIENIWCKKVWEITGPSPTNKIELQVKRNQPYNLRPKKWYGVNVSIFQSAEEFIFALNEACAKFDSPPIWDDQWRVAVEKNFVSKMGIKLADY